jgi:2-methylisocitrate lyase-like PEP mutase family enzyme
MTRFSTKDSGAFAELHRQAEPLLLPNAWDAASAWIAQQAGAQAIATSSAAVAWALGYADGSTLPREELLPAVARIVRVASVPVTVDLEDGYSDDPIVVAKLAAQVREAGAVGINLEDGSGPVELLARKIEAIRSHAVARELFINARTDVYLLGMAKDAAAIEMTVARGRAYAAAGADGVFVPGLSDIDSVRAVVARIALPLNLMKVPRLPSANECAEAGVKRISMGAGLFLQAYATAAQQAHAFLQQGGHKAATAPEVTGKALNAAFTKR